jgi:hypothetical protein
VLSVLARLGEDPWGEAARWASLPKTTNINTLAQYIAKMPLGAEAIADARVTAARLILLLPSQTGPSLLNKRSTIVPSVMPTWLPMALLCCFLVFNIVVCMLLAPKQTGATLAPTGKTSQQGQ